MKLFRRIFDLKVDVKVDHMFLNSNKNDTEVSLLSDCYNIE